MQIIKYLALILFFYFSIKIYAQDSLYARYIIDILASPAFHGRGYTFNSDKMASNFIVNELKNFNILTFDSSYLQTFKINVNLFPDKMQVTLNKQELVPGKDFLVGAESCSIKGKFKVVLLDAKTIADKVAYEKFKQKSYSKVFIAIDTVGLNNLDFKSEYKKIVEKNTFHAKGIITFESKLTHEIAMKQNDFVHLIVLNSDKQTKYKSIILNIDAQFKQNSQTQNVIGYIKGQVDSFIVFTAHYDHLGTMGKDVFFPGANDNAVGVAMVLDLAKTFAKMDTLPHYSIAFMLFSGEELGLVGSQYYTNNPVFPLSKIKFLVNLDVVGSGDDGIQIVNSSIFKKQYEQLAKINDSLKLIKKILKRGAAANSDHYFFYQKGVPSFFIYSRGSYLEYHNIYDTRKNVPLYAYNQIFKLIYNFALNYKN